MAGVAVALVACLPLPAGTTGPADPYPLEYPAYFGNRFSIPADNPVTRQGVLLGRALFYEPRLSSNNKVSCATCHQQERAFTDGQRFSIGVDGVPTKRNSMSLANLLWVRNLFWDGRSRSLEEQALVPLFDAHEMNQSPEVSAEKLGKDPRYRLLFRNAFGDERVTGDRIVKALAQFERALISVNSPYDQYLQGTYTPQPAEQRGMDLFMGHNAVSGLRVNCVHCHGSPKLMVELFHNNGLDTVPADSGRAEVTKQGEDHGRFRVPTLRNIALTAPYMHDGRFNTMREVLDHYSDHIQPGETLSAFIPDSTDGHRRGLLLRDSQKEDIIAFLQMLTDSTFVTNPAFGPPSDN